MVQLAGTARGICRGIVARLLSKQAGLVTGQEFSVEGGMTWRVIYRGCGSRLLALSLGAKKKSLWAIDLASMHA
ncbi:hypothetical protein [Geopseudomonas aromaticivorans]|uniref:hypothetical protein n=1 Tax=Geopseudomonas aromaticivorans TaxID=2849492 RepID=UPI003F5D519C